MGEAEKIQEDINLLVSELDDIRLLLIVKQFLERLSAN